VAVRRGGHQFALAKQGGPIVPLAGQATISEPSILRVHYIDRSGQRTLGLAIGVVGALGGLVMMIASVHDEQQCDGATCTTHPAVDDGWAVSGLVVFAGSIVTSAVLLNQRDAVQVSVTPFRLTPLDPRLDTYRLLNHDTQTHGAAVTLRF
jgi:hypothetical protein